jgi:hypothetical protein
MSELFGRVRELAAIERFITALPGSLGGPAALIVSGEAGMGKTDGRLAI